MKGKYGRKRYSREFKVDAVKLLNEQGYTYKQASEALGVTPGMLNRWRQELELRGDSVFPGNGKQLGMEEEVRQLREENRRLVLEREILKKAAVFFAQEKS